jgi:hypothetical protein
MSAHQTANQKQMRAIKMTTNKNAEISAKIISLVMSGKDLVEAWNEVLGSVMTYEQFADDLYYTLRGEK